MVSLDNLIDLQADSTGGPLYIRLRQALRRSIESGALSPSSALPPERVIAGDLGVSRVTVRRAIQDLVDEGVLDRRHGAGTFVSLPPRSDRIEKNFNRITSFSEDITARGMQPGSRWIGKSQGTVTPEEALMFGLSPGTRVFRFHRLRHADGRPLAIEYSTIVASALGSIDDVGESLYDALDAAGARPTRAVQRLRAILFDTKQAELLEVDAGAPGLLIERRGFLKDGRPIEITRSAYRGDAYDFVAELGSDGDA